jgi:hypothetical protein
MSTSQNEKSGGQLSLWIDPNPNVNIPPPGGALVYGALRTTLFNPQNFWFKPVSTLLPVAALAFGPSVTITLNLSHRSHEPARLQSAERDWD